jgi:GntR family carbon starvation induced transcriptional regulator
MAKFPLLPSPSPVANRRCTGHECVLSKRLGILSALDSRKRLIVKGLKLKELRIIDQQWRSLIGGTLASDVLHRLRDDIVSCVLMPGERLRFEPLREIYGASFSTLREALSRLASERLVISEGQRGFSVAPISREDLLDLTDARVLIERECVARSIERAGDEWKAAMLAAFHRLDRIEAQLAERPVPSVEWEGVHANFHECLVVAAGSPTLMEIRQSLFDRARRYRRLSTLTRKTPRAKNNEHRAIMEAVMSRDVPLAQQLLEEHIRATSTNVLHNLPAKLDQEAVGQVKIVPEELRR